MKKILNALFLFCICAALLLAARQVLKRFEIVKVEKKKR